MSTRIGNQIQLGNEASEELQKALTAGSGTDSAAFQGGRALIFESIEASLITVLHSTDDAVLFQKLKTDKFSKSIVHEWTDRTDVGAGDGAWVPEGGESEESDSTYSRQTLEMKFVQTRRNITLQALAAETIEDVTAQEQQSGLLWIIAQVERAIFFGKNSVNPQEPDGLESLIPASNVIDARGISPGSDAMENFIQEGATVIRESHGMADLFIANPSVIRDIQSLVRERLRFGVGDTSSAAIVMKYPTIFGNLDLKEDIFATRPDILPVASSLTAKRPGQPAIAAVSTTATSSKALTTIPAGRTSKFNAIGDVGTYNYKIVAVNMYGNSVASASVPITIVKNGAMSVYMNPNSGEVPLGYKIYRSVVGGASGTEKFISYVKNTAASGGLVFVDTNDDLPGSTSAYILSCNPMRMAIEWKQFLPAIKYDLFPTASATKPFLMLLFGALMMTKKLQHVRIKNLLTA